MSTPSTRAMLPAPADGAPYSPPADVLAGQYASPAVAQIWSPRTQVVLERRLWLAVLRAQHAEGLRVPSGVLDDYARVVEQVDLDAIRRREGVTRHDLKARLEEFNALAGHQHVHKGLTSCDITDNITQARIRMSLLHLRDRAALLAAAGPAVRAEPERPDGPDGPDGQDRDGAASTLRSASARLSAVLERYPLRGIKGPVGTAQDMLDLLGGDTAALARIERRVMEHLGFTRVLDSVGQLSFRSLDHEVLCALTDFTLAAGSAARAAGPVHHERAARIRAFAVLSRGYAVMAAQLAGEQWNEGDVSCSVVRRVAVPGAVHAADAALTTVAETCGRRTGRGRP